MKKTQNRGGKREGAGRPDQGKARYTVTLTADNAESAKAREANFSGLLDRLLARWLSRS
jgi:Post-segregation antitoxin CcdA